jgi:sugar phosphate isomerase/epimerase
MKIGICSTDYPVQSPETLFRSIRQTGFDLVQLNFAAFGMDELPDVISPALISRIQTELRQNDLELVAINGTFNILAPDLATRRAGFARFPILAEAASRLGCPIVSVCTGTYDPVSMWRDHPGNTSEQAWQDMLAGMHDLAETAAQYRIWLGVETEASNVICTPERARRLLDELASPWVKIILDAANLFQVGTADPGRVRPTLKNAFACLGRDIILAHGKDIHAGADIRFASPGTGIIDYDYFLELLDLYQYRGGMVLHGNLDPADIPRSLSFMRDVIGRRRTCVDPPANS